MGTPTSHLEIINACPAADVEVVDKTGVKLPGTFKVGDGPETLPALM
jgi:hypothetical protein